MTDVQSVAGEALRLAAVDPPAADALAATALTQARRERAWDAVCVAERARGVAAMQQSRLDEAIDHLRSAVVAGRRAGNAGCSGEARMSLASALMLKGRPRQSFREIDRALEDLDGVAAARARAQRAAILQELGRLDDALKDFRRALPVLRRSGDVQWSTRALSNRGLLHTARREFSAAESDLLAARELCQQNGLRLPGAIVEHNLAFVDSQRGDVPAALKHLSAAQVAFEQMGLADGSLLTDRAELLLSVRLMDEARTTAEAAVVADERFGRLNHLPEAHLLLSTIALVQGDSSRALTAADLAARGFERLGRREWLTLARYARIQALREGKGQITPGQCRRAADALAEAGWIVPALEARLLAGRLALDRGQKDTARKDLGKASRARRSTPADARARAWLAEAMLREADGRRRGAVAALRAGIRVLEDHRATMGATELRAHVTVHRGSIARMGLRLALEDRSPRNVLWWAESGRATSTLLRRAHPPDDPVLADILAELRAVTAETEDRRNDAQPTTALVHRQVVLERRIRDHCREVAGSGDGLEARPHLVDEVQGALGTTALVEYVEQERELFAVTVVAGKVRLHHLGSLQDIQSHCERIPFALRRLAGGRASAASRQAALNLLDRSGAFLDDVLLRPLARHLRDRPLVVVPVGVLQSLPWSLLASCAGRPVAVSPSAALWHAASARRGQDYSGVVVVAGPGLPGARAEAAEITRLHPGAVQLVDQHATAANVSRAMDGAALVHLAAHGRVRSDNALFSALTLADGPFTVYDLERLTRAPHHVVLAACDTGHSEVVARGEILGFTAALMAGGTGTLVAPVVPVPDAETVELMTAYHRELRAGVTPAEALAAAQSAMVAAGDAARAAAVGFVCLGSGHSVAVAAGAAAGSSAGSAAWSSARAAAGSPAGHAADLRDDDARAHQLAVARHPVPLQGHHTSVRSR